MELHLQYSKGLVEPVCTLRKDDQKKQEGNKNFHNVI